MTQTVDVTQLAAKWPELLAAVQAGGEVIVTDKNVPQVRLTPLPELHAEDTRLASWKFSNVARFRR